MSILDVLAKGARVANRVLDTPVDEAIRYVGRLPGAERVGNAVGMGAANTLIGGMAGAIPMDDPRLSPDERLQLILRAALMSGAGGALAGGALGERSMLPAAASLFGSAFGLAPMSMGMFGDAFHHRAPYWQGREPDPRRQR